MRYIRKVKYYMQGGGKISWQLLHIISNRKFKRVLLHSRTENITHSARRINSLIVNPNCKYLEIGVEFGFTLEGVNSNFKYAVDPNPRYVQKKNSSNTKTFIMTSDKFFDSLSSDEVFDVIFLDGLHTADQLLKDFLNSIKHIKKDSWILIDDVLPRDSISSLPDLKESLHLRATLGDFRNIWHGDCFKLLPILRKYFPQFYQFLIIYPDNPQLLLRLRNGAHIPDITLIKLDELLIEMDAYKYLDTLSHKFLSNFDICIEEPFFARIDEVLK